MASMRDPTAGGGQCFSGGTGRTRPRGGACSSLLDGREPLGLQKRQRGEVPPTKTAAGCVAWTSGGGASVMLGQTTAATSAPPPHRQGDGRPLRKRRRLLGRGTATDVSRGRARRRSLRVVVGGGWRAKPRPPRQWPDGGCALALDAQHPHTTSSHLSPFVKASSASCSRFTHPSRAVRCTLVSKPRSPLNTLPPPPPRLLLSPTQTPTWGLLWRAPCLASSSQSRRPRVAGEGTGAAPARTFLSQRTRPLTPTSFSSPPPALVP